MTPPPLASTASPEIIHRPEPGLARGLWEATPSALYLALVGLVLAATAYLGWRLRRSRTPRVRH